jgi:hypothetical protein
MEIMQHLEMAVQVAQEFQILTLVLQLFTVVAAAVEREVQLVVQLV